jgi:protein-tyrosine phosphatase
VGEVEASFFVDWHSHVCPSGDDGAQSLAEGVSLCESAVRHGTRVLYATPHVWPHFPLDEEREAFVRGTFEQLRARAPAELDLRLGWELTPDPPLLDEDPERYRLEGTDCVLVEVPFAGPSDLLLAVGEHVEAAGLTPLVAHPERTESVLARPALAEELAERGWPLQVNATSLLGRHGPEPEELGWRLLHDDVATAVASDGHRASRPAHLDRAYELALAQLGPRARALFDGSGLGAVSRRRPASRAASTSA